MAPVGFPRRRARSGGWDVDHLEAELREAVEGEVRFDPASRALYATDASNFRQEPIGVVAPAATDGVVATHEVCRRHRVPILSRGSGTSLSGETVNHAVVIDFAKHLDAIEEVDVERRLVSAQPGAVNDKVNELAGRHGLAFGPDPSTHEYCTIGGNIGNNSCGTHSLHARLRGNGSRTSDNVEELEVLTYDGLRLRVGPTTDEQFSRYIAAGGRRAEIYAALRSLSERYGDLIRERFAPIPRRVSGYNLDELLPENGFNVARALVGTEGTCVTVLEATLQLVPVPAARALLVVGYPDIFAVGRHLEEILEAGPMACEAIDERLFHAEQASGTHRSGLSQLPAGDAWVLVELGADTKQDADKAARALTERLQGDRDAPCGVALFDDLQQERRLWKVREAALASETFPPGEVDRWQGWEDSAVPPERVGPYLRDLRELLDRYGYQGAMYGHLADGCIHSSISFDLRTVPGLEAYRSFLEEAADLVVSYGGSLSGEHGDGQQRGELLSRMFGDELVQAFREFKAIWDPGGRMNPGKVVDADRFDEHLKQGAGYNPPRPRTSFSYPADGGDFAHAVLRCVGIGKCRKVDGDEVMCPSYKVLREEKHTTRGRARLLFEMLEGDIVTDGWRSREVFDALDLCLACKGCTNDCPVGVDMPTYKAEFLHRYWARRLRPRHAYAFGFIDKAARLGSKMAPVYNLAARSPASRVIKAAAGIAPQRELPQLARTTLQQWFRDHHSTSQGPQVVLWPDTFSNYFDAAAGIAAVEVLRGAGCDVLMPASHVCCGRPLYDFGFLETAKRYLQRALEHLRPWIRRGIPVAGVEPSCVAVFKHELPQLLSHDDDARRLAASTFHFSELLERFELDVPAARGNALVWGHCHHQATGGISSEVALLERAGVDVDVVRGGCCGLAGSWGYEKHHHDLSLACGEEALLPAVRGAPAGSRLVADGFSCRMQIHAATGREALHVAQLLRGGSKAGAAGLG